jgi:predicted house-cleaning noncanonical NTP pyrophosphatase (MazG superfamily)
MKYFQVSKLVRDKIVDNMIKNNQETFGVRKLDDEEYFEELKKKLQEELEEFLNAEGEEKLRDELVDVLEVIDYLKKALKIKDKDIDEKKAEKEQKNGGFKERIYLESVGMEENNPWFDYYIKNPDKYPLIEKP